MPVKVEKLEDDYVISVEPSVNVPSTVYRAPYLYQMSSRWIALQAREYHRQFKLFTDMLVKSTNTILIAEESLYSILKFADSLEALIFTLEQSSMHRFILSREDEKVHELPNPHLGMYILWH